MLPIFEKRNIMRNQLWKSNVNRVSNRKCISTESLSHNFRCFFVVSCNCSIWNEWTRSLFWVHLYHRFILKLLISLRSMLFLLRNTFTFFFIHGLLALSLRNLLIYKIYSINIINRKTKKIKQSASRLLRTSTVLMPFIMFKFFLKPWFPTFWKYFSWNFYHNSIKC